jgi:modulator of drug activity B
MTGKYVFVSATWNAPLNGFNHIDQMLFAGRTADDVLFNVGLKFKFGGYSILPGYHCVDVMKNPNLEIFFSAYQKHLDMIMGMAYTAITSFNYSFNVI